MTEPVLDQVRRIAADIFDMPLEQVTAESSPDTVETWDSLQHLNLVVALEQNFRLAFAPEEIEEMLSIKLVVTLIHKKLRLAS